MRPSELQTTGSPDLEGLFDLLVSTPNPEFPPLFTTDEIPFKFLETTEGIYTEPMATFPDLFFTTQPPSHDTTVADVNFVTTEESADSIFNDIFGVST